MGPRGRIKIVCSCPMGYHIYPGDSIVVDSIITDYPEDWWILDKCKKCGSTMKIGGDDVNSPGSGITAPEYV